MKIASISYILLLLAGPCFGQTQEKLCPKHIEPPTYPPLAREARMSAEVTLTLTIDADGKVKFVEVTTNHPEIKSIEVLANYAVQNVQKWTFSKPASAPFRQTIIYDYKLDKNFPGPGFTVDFDLPDRVTISANLQPPPTQF